MSERVDIVELAYREFGNEEAPAVILIHPFPFDGRMWFDAADQIASHGWRVIVPDLRGCGRTPLGEAVPSMDQLAHDVASLCKRLNVDQPFLGGISLGGYVAMAITRLGLFDTAGLVLVDTKAGEDSAEARENRLRVAQQMRDGDERAVALFAEAMLGKLISEHSSTWVPEIQNQLREWMNDTPAATIAWLQEAMAGRPDSLASLSKYTHSALLIRGELDEVCTPADYAAMVDVLPHSQFVTIPLIGHLPTIEDSKSLTQAVVHWLGSNS